MTQITFLHGARDRLQAVAAWLAHAGGEVGPVLVYVPDRERAEQLDRLLWTHAATGFVPHCRANDKLAAETPILITDSLEAVAQEERLMNLSREIPPGFSRFESLIEVVGQEENDRAAARDRVKVYKERGCEVRYFDLSDR